MPYAGELFVNLELTSNISQGVQKAKQELGQLNPAVGQTGQAVDKLSLSTKSMVRPLMDMGQGLTAVGMSAFAAGTLMGESGEGYRAVGAGIMTIGSATMFSMPLLKAFSAIMTGEASLAITKWAATVNMSRNSLLLLGGALGIVAVVGLAAYTAAAESSKNATAVFDKEIKKLNESTDELRYIQTASDEKLKGLKSTMDNSRDSIKGLQDDYDKLNETMGKQLDIADKLRHADLSIADALQSKKDANKDLVKAQQTGDQDEIQRARNRKRNADEAYNDSLRNKKAVQDEDATQKATIKTLEDKNKVTSPQQLLDKISGVIDAQSKAQEKYNAQLLITEGIENRIKKNDFYAKLLDWQKSGVILSEEDKSAYSAGPEWMKSAYSDYSRKYASTTKNPDYLYNILGPAYEQVAGGYGYLRGENTGQVEDFTKTANNNIRWSPQTVTNPNAGGMAGTFNVIINGTVTDKQFTINLSDLTQNGVHYT